MYHGGAIKLFRLHVALEREFECYNNVCHWRTYTSDMVVGRWRDCVLRTYETLDFSWEFYSFLIDDCLDVRPH